MSVETVSAPAQLDVKIAFLGAGQMAQALATGFTQAELVSGDNIYFHDPSDEASARMLELIPTARRLTEPSQLSNVADYLFLAVKPQYLEQALLPALPIAEACCLVSIVAGVTMDRIAQLSGTHQVIRVMPNTPCLIGQGVSGVAAHDEVALSDANRVMVLLESVGLCERLPEPLLAVVTGLAGSGPAYVFAFLEAMIDGAVRQGLPRSTATRFAVQTLLGSAKLARDQQEHVAVLRDRVTSPGGTTAAGLHALEKQGFRAAVSDAIEAATRRARELSG